MKRSKALESLAYHEAGHAVAAFHHNVRVKKRSILPEPGSSGRLTPHPSYFSGIHPESDTSPRVQRRLENMVLVCCAGPAAQRRFNPRGYRTNQGQGDWHQAIDLLSHLSGDSEILLAYFNLIDLQARKFVHLPWAWSCIEDLAAALLEHKELTGKQVRSVVEETIRREDAA